MSFFDELKVSLEEAVEIKNGTKFPARVTRYELTDARPIRKGNKSSQKRDIALGKTIATEWKE
ncbi:NadS family protein [Thiopseudomonas alkaliphila]|uniref:NadS family protein n=1 Tax=Thiopseudomonas alkaliphila TaxID=1697053 RepID=UPI0022B1E1EC|nr:NadS family protein [Thiopseudomonas alkaliphila]